MAHKDILQPELTEGLRRDLSHKIYKADVAIHSKELWNELLKTGFSPDLWSIRNQGNIIYLKN